MLQITYPDMPALSDFSGAPISIHGEGLDLVDLCHLINAKHGTRFILHPEVNGHYVDLDVDDVPWDEILHRISSSEGLALRIVEGTIELGRGTQEPTDER